MKENHILKKGLEIMVYVALIANVTSIVLGIIATIGSTAISNIAGIMFVISLGVNLAVLFFNFASLNRVDPKGKRLKNLCYIFMIFFFFALILIFYNQLVFVLEMDLMSRHYIIAYIIHISGYFGILGFGLLITLFDFKYLPRPETWIP
jgi:hypothetical protein